MDRDRLRADGRRRSARAGFTLLEIMVAVAIVAILASLALPNFIDQGIRGQVAEGIGMTQFVRDAVQASYSGTQAMPADNAAAGVPPADRIVGRTVAGTTVKAGAVVIVFGNQAGRSLAGHRLSMRPAIVEGYPAVPITWVCGPAPVPGKMTVHMPDETDLPPAWLPVNCRGGAKQH